MVKSHLPLTPNAFTYKRIRDALESDSFLQIQFCKISPSWIPEVPSTICVCYMCYLTKGSPILHPNPFTSKRRVMPTSCVFFFKYICREKVTGSLVETPLLHFIFTFYSICFLRARNSNPIQTLCWSLHRVEDLLPFPYLISCGPGYWLLQA